MSYWKPIFITMEVEGISDILINAASIKNVSGLIPDDKGAEGIADCLKHRLLSASFVKPIIKVARSSSVSRIMTGISLISAISQALLRQFLRTTRNLRQRGCVQTLASRTPYCLTPSDKRCIASSFDVCCQGVKCSIFRIIISYPLHSSLKGCIIYIAINNLMSNTATDFISKDGKHGALRFYVRYRNRARP